MNCGTAAGQDALEAARTAPFMEKQGHVVHGSESRRGQIVRTRHPTDCHSWCGRFSVANSVWNSGKPLRRARNREGDSPVKARQSCNQVHLIVVVLIVRDAAPRTAGTSELAIQRGIEPDDSSVEFRRHADLREETPLELTSRRLISHSGLFSFRCWSLQWMISRVRFWPSRCPPQPGEAMNIRDDAERIHL